MESFIIIEMDDGLTIATVLPGQTPEEVAAQQHGVLIDSGLYRSYEEAIDALSELESEDEESRQST